MKPIDKNLINGSTQRYSSGNDPQTVDIYDKGLTQRQINGNWTRTLQITFDTAPRIERSRRAFLNITKEGAVHLATRLFGGRRALIDHLIQLERDEADIDAQARVDNQTEVERLRKELDEAKAKITSYRIMG